MIFGGPEYIAALKTKIHNAKQRIESLRKKRKHLRGRLNAGLAEVATAELLLTNTDAELEHARAMLKGLRLALELDEHTGRET